MTDRYKGVVVTFDSDIRDDDSQCILDAISMIKGVVSVTPSITNHEDHMNREIIRRDLISKILEIAKRYG
jgi:hypothetical protein